MPEQAEVNIQRTLRSMNVRWFENGVEDFSLGLFGTVMGCWYLQDLPANLRLFLPIPLCAIAVLCIRWYLVKSVIMPRSGYVKFRFTWKFWAACAAVLVALLTLEIAMLVIWVAYQLPDLTRFAGGIGGVMMATLLGVIGFKAHLVRWRWYGALILVFGAITCVWDFGDDSPSWVMLGIGVTMLLSGAQLITSFVKTRQTAEDYCG